tara:strand:+ start:2935 stop:3351 length:417 start_codon:yes stop_codon:yes gene_type:complete
MRNILLLLWLFLFTACNTEKEPWTNSQLIEPSDLNIIISKQNKLPNIISVGPGKVIPSSIGVGECRYEKNLNILKNHLLSFSKDSEIILYCGCCPFKDCPNIRPAFSLLNSLGYKNHKLLNIRNNIKTDWIDMNYPID